MDEPIVDQIQLLYPGLVLFLIGGFRFGGATSHLLMQCGTQKAIKHSEGIPGTDIGER